jgi:hypothetical protein
MAVAAREVAAAGSGTKVGRTARQASKRPAGLVPVPTTMVPSAEMASMPRPVQPAVLMPVSARSTWRGIAPKSRCQIMGMSLLWPAMIEPSWEMSMALASGPGKSSSCIPEFLVHRKGREVVALRLMPMMVVPSPEMAVAMLEESPKSVPRLTMPVSLSKRKARSPSLELE